MAAAASTTMLSLLFVSAICVSSGAVAGAMTALDDVCLGLGSYYVTPDFCKSALCYDPSSPCRDARDVHAVAALAARLAAANATAARDSVKAAADAAASSNNRNSTVRAGLRSCLQLYTGFVAALEWAAGSAAAGRYAGAREVVNAAKHLDVGCSGMAGAAAIPRENAGFFDMAYVAYAVLASVA